MVIIVATTTEEIKEAFAWLTENVNAVNLGEIVAEKRPMTGAERTAKWRAGKKAQQGDVTETSQPSQDDKEKREEEREEKEWGSPLSSPLPFPPNTPYPIPPIIPPSQEKEEREGERKESFLASVTDSGETKKPRELMPYGTYVRLTHDEFQKLVDKFGVVKVDEMIQRMDNYIGEDPKRQKKYETRNHYLTLLNWERMDLERRNNQLQQLKPQQKSWIEVAREIEAEERGEVVDL